MNKGTPNRAAETWIQMWIYVHSYFGSSSQTVPKVWWGTQAQISQRCNSKKAHHGFKYHRGLYWCLSCVFCVLAAFLLYTGSLIRKSGPEVTVNTGSGPVLSLASAGYSTKYVSMGQLLAHVQVLTACATVCSSILCHSLYFPLDEGLLAKTNVGANLGFQLSLRSSASSMANGGEHYHP